MMKRLVSLLAVLVISVTLVVPTAFAHERGEHDHELEMTLFDTQKSPFSKNQQDSRYTALNALENAVYLSIDQFGNSGVTSLGELAAYGVKGLPATVAELNPPPEETQLSARNHRMYTHRGWDFVYPIDKANWNKRRSILTGTVQKVFGFKDSKQGESFAAVLYYVHVLGDYLEDSDFKQFNGTSNGLKIPFASPNYTSTADIFSELEHHLGIVFRDQHDKRTYSSLMSELSGIAERARGIAGSWGGINNEDSYNDIHECAKMLMALLCGECGEYRYFNRIHTLLMNETFFTSVFYSNGY